MKTVVKVTTTSIVKPAIPTPPQTMFLSSLDVFLMPFSNSQRLLFYAVPPANDYSSILETLKKSLSSVMVYFYPLAGRLSNCETGRPEMDCNDEGVEFLEASIDICFEDLEKDGFRHKPFFRKLVHEVNDSADESYSRPLLSIQVYFLSFGKILSLFFINVLKNDEYFRLQLLKGGGMCIETTIHHVMADGNSFWHFMISWADCSRGLPISKHPRHDRVVLKRGKTNPISISFKAHEIVSHEITGTKIFKFLPDDLPSDEMKASGSWNMEKSKEALQKWGDRKRETEVVYSTFCFTEDIILAPQFLRCVMMARDVPWEEVIYFLVLANCRECIQPPLLPNFFGNCLSMGVTQTFADTLINVDISFAANVIQQLIKSCTEEEQIKHLID